MPLKGKFRPKNYKKYKGDPTKITYRSSWEKQFMEYLDKSPKVIAWASEEIKIPYMSPVDKRLHRYYPDFYVETKNNKGEIEKTLIEIKPLKQTAPPKKPKLITESYIKQFSTWKINEAKWKAAEFFCKDRKWKWKILTEKELGIKIG